MIVGRLIYQGSKLALSQCTAYSALWSLCGSEGPIDVNEHCYAPMDRLLERQHAIQKTPAAKHLTNGSLMLYDITSSYFEGEYAGSEIVAVRLQPRPQAGHEQIVIGLSPPPKAAPSVSRSLPATPRMPAPS